MYLNEFAAAAERTKSLGLNCPNIDVSDERFLSEEKMSQFPFALRDAVGESVGGRCTIASDSLQRCALSWAICR